MHATIQSFPTAVERTALEALAIGIVVTDGSGRLLYSNPTAERVLDRHDGALCRAGERIAATCGPTQAALMTLLANACRPGAAKARQAGDHLLAPARRTSHPDAALRLLPIAGPSPSVGHAMIFVREIERRCNLEMEGMRLFGLTEMEAKFASALASGLSLAEAAMVHQVSVSTARAHLSRVFQKTGTRQQSQVAALLRGAQIPVESSQRSGSARDARLAADRADRRLRK